MSAPAIAPAELVGECLTGSVRRLLGGVHSLTSARVVVVCVDAECVRVTFSADPGRLGAPWQPDGQPGWFSAPRGSEPGLRDGSADPVLVVVGVGERAVVAVNVLAIDEIGVCCRGRGELIGNWLMQGRVQGAEGDGGSLAGVRLSENPDATVVVADPLVDGAAPGWVDVLAAGTSWPVRPLRTPAADAEDGDAAADGSPGDGDVAGAGSADDSAPVTVADTFDGEESGDPGEGEAAASVAGDGGRMTVFGRFEVTDSDGVALQPMQQQIIGAIAILQPIPTAELCQLLYGTERSKSFHVAMSKMRRRGLQPVATDDGYRIDIDSDWAQFRALIGSDPSAASTEALERAAQVVDGPLFGNEPPSWAVAQVPGMAAVVAQVCRELAARHSGDREQALGYARRGLAVAPGHPELGEIVSILNTIGGQQDTGGDVTA